MLPGSLDKVKAGAIGTVAQMDTINPVLYLDWGEQGRLKLFGTILNPKAKLLLLKKEKFKSTESVVCDQVFDTLVVFPKYSWVGTKAENPSEEPLDMPSGLSQVFDQKAAAADSKTAKKTPQQTPSTAEADARRSGRQRKTVKYVEKDSGDDGEEEESSDADSDAPLQPRAKRARNVAAKRPKASDSGSEEEDSGGQDGNDDAESSGSDILERYSQGRNAASEGGESAYLWSTSKSPSTKETLSRTETATDIPAWAVSP